MKHFHSTVLWALLLTLTFVARVSSRDVIEEWSEEFRPSVLSIADQKLEMQWFRDTARDWNLTGLTILSTAESAMIHHYENEVLAKAFFDITGIKVEHIIMDEGNLVSTISEQVRTGRRYFDIYVHDADSNGFHARTGRLHKIALKNPDGTYSANPELGPTNPKLDLDDWMNIYFGEDFDGDIIQLPDQQFVNLYFYRYDWMTNDTIKTVFEDIYSYRLGVPKTWKSYEDIAKFFRHHCRFMNADDIIPTCYQNAATGPPGWNDTGSRAVYGHADYGALSTLEVTDGELIFFGPSSLSWRYTDAWLSMAGSDDAGLPNGGGENGTGVDEWGISAEKFVPHGASVARGGAMNSFAAEYALNKSIDWMFAYAPEAALDWDFLTAGSKPARGDIAQMIFQYTPDLAGSNYKYKSSPVVNTDGTLRWRVAPSPVGRYWDEGSKVGYQDAGAWSIPKTTQGKRLEAAWLWAQFCVSKTVDLKRFVVAGTPIRKSTVEAQYVTDRIDFWGGLVEFYRSNLRHQWTDTGLNVPHYPALAQVWAPNIAKAMVRAGNVRAGEKEPFGYTPKQAVDAIARHLDTLMSRIRFNHPKTPNLRAENSATMDSGIDNKAPKPERESDRDQKWTVELDPNVQDYSAFWTRYIGCTVPNDADCII